MLTLPSMDPLTKYLSSTGWKSRDVTKSVCLQDTSTLSYSPSQPLLCLIKFYCMVPEFVTPADAALVSGTLARPVSPLDLGVPTSPMVA